MKLQKRLSRKYKNKKYHKYVVVIPEKDVGKAGMGAGDELISMVKKGKIILVKK
jgi:bifunctional DNA-binding transcriptional regulator/antitoxin component of YhaV-PrlF toxin-antitoxin module